MSFAVIRTVRKGIPARRRAAWDAETVEQLLTLLSGVEAEELAREARSFLDQIRACFGSRWPHDWLSVHKTAKAKLLAEHHINRIGKNKRKR